MIVNFIMDLARVTSAKANNPRERINERAAFSMVQKCKMLQISLFRQDKWHLVEGTSMNQKGFRCWPHKFLLGKSLCVFLVDTNTKIKSKKQTTTENPGVTGPMIEIKEGGFREIPVRSSRVPT